VPEAVDVTDPTTSSAVPTTSSAVDVTVPTGSSTADVAVAKTWVPPKGSSACAGTGPAKSAPIPSRRIRRLRHIRRTFMNFSHACTL
jgi:hypothetical protein